MNETLGQRILQLRRSRMTMRRIATVVGRCVATLSRCLSRLGLSSLKALEPTEAVVRYEHDAPGAVIHVDTKKPGRILRQGHRVTDDPPDLAAGVGLEFVHVAIDGHSRVGFVQMHDDAWGSAEDFLQAAMAHYAALGVRIERPLADNGAASRSSLFVKTCQALDI